MSENEALIPIERIVQKIILLRGQKVMLDSDLAQLYGVETKALNRAVKRNAGRFPVDFMFQLTAQEASDLRCQNGTSNSAQPSSAGGRRYAPYAFTEQGVAMLSSVLHSPQAVRVNIEIMRAFVSLRGLMATHAELAQKLRELERKYDGQFATVFKALQALMTPALPEPKGKIGFVDVKAHKAKPSK
jgi:hypothetical protein